MPVIFVRLDRADEHQLGAAVPPDQHRRVVVDLDELDLAPVPRVAVRLSPAPNAEQQVYDRVSAEDRAARSNDPSAAIAPESGAHPCRIETSRRSTTTAARMMRGVSRLMPLDDSSR